MKPRDTPLPQEERYGWYPLSQQEISLRAMAKAMMGRSRTTLSRELKRNTGQTGSRSPPAQHLAESRHQEQRKAMKLTEPVCASSQENRQAWWSPEHIRGRVRLAQAILISPATVSRFVLKEKPQGGPRSHG